MIHKARNWKWKKLFVNEPKHVGMGVSQHQTKSWTRLAERTEPHSRWTSPDQDLASGSGWLWGRRKQARRGRRNPGSQRWIGGDSSRGSSVVCGLRFTTTRVRSRVGWRTTPIPSFFGPFKIPAHISISVTYFMDEPFIGCALFITSKILLWLKTFCR